MRPKQSNWKSYKKIFLLSSFVMAAQGHAKFDIDFKGGMLFSYIAGSQDQKGVIEFTSGPIDEIIPSGTFLATHNSDAMTVLSKLNVTVSATKQCSDTTKVSFIGAINGNMASNIPCRELYTKLENTSFGALVVGNTKGPESRSVEGISMPGTGGVDGNYLRFVLPTTGCGVSPTVPLGSTGDATKAIYYTPRFLGLDKDSGIQLAASFTPNSNHFGEASMNVASPLKPGQTFDVGTMVLAGNLVVPLNSYAKITLSSAHLTADTVSEKSFVPQLDRESVSSYDSAALLSIGPWSFGVEYIQNGNSGRLKNDSKSPITPVVPNMTFESKNYFAKKAGDFYSLYYGGVYRKDKFSAGISYFYSSRNTGFLPLTSNNGISSLATTNAYSISFEYLFTEGVSAYVEGVLCEMSNPDWAYIGAYTTHLTKTLSAAAPSNKAAVFLFGLKIQF